MLYELITRELPYLRRYARAVTGDQVAGDLCVEEMLQEHILKPQPADSALPEDRVTLFRLLDAILVSTPRSSQSDIPFSALLRMSSLPRRALFLTAVEQFHMSAAATILGINQEELTAILKEAENDLASTLTTDVLTIEDEPIIAIQLKEIIESLGHKVAAHATTYDEAVAHARSTRPGLILVDIQLADGSSGLDAMDSILEFHSAPCIVITAHPERLLSGRLNEPAFLIPKPFKVEHVKTIVSQALLMQQMTEASD